MNNPDTTDFECIDFISNESNQLPVDRTSETTSISKNSLNIPTNDSKSARPPPMYKQNTNKLPLLSSKMIFPSFHLESNNTLIKPNKKRKQIVPLSNQDYLFYEPLPPRSSLDLYIEEYFTPIFESLIEHLSPDIAKSETIILLNHQWDQLTPFDKLPYDKQSDLDYERYLNEMHELHKDTTKETINSIQQPINNIIATPIDDTTYYTNSSNLTTSSLLHPNSNYNHNHNNVNYYQYNSQDNGSMMIDDSFSSVNYSYDIPNTISMDSNSSKMFDPYHITPRTHGCQHKSLQQHYKSHDILNQSLDSMSLTSQIPSYPLYPALYSDPTDRSIISTTSTSLTTNNQSFYSDIFSRNISCQEEYSIIAYKLLYAVSKSGIYD